LLRKSKEHLISHILQLKEENPTVSLSETGIISIDEELAADSGIGDIEAMVLSCFSSKRMSIGGTLDEILDLVLQKDKTREKEEVKKAAKALCMNGLLVEFKGYYKKN